MDYIIFFAVLIVVVLFWIFITPMLFSHGSSTAFEMAVSSIIFGIIFICIAGANLI